jgi:replicative DNA helicase
MKAMSDVDLSQPKLPPQNLEAEQSVLGAILLDNAAMAKAMELLVEEDFYRTSHRKIYRAMLELSDVGEVIDQITLTERLKAEGELEASGGRPTWRNWFKSCPVLRMFGITARSSVTKRYCVD